MIIKQQYETHYQQIEVVEIPLKSYNQASLFNQEIYQKKNTKYQFPIPRFQQKQDISNTEPSKQVKSVRFKDEVEIINQELIIPKQRYAEPDEEKAPLPALLPVSKLIFPLKLDQIRKQIDEDIQHFKINPNKIQQQPCEIPKRFLSVSRQEREKKINRLNSIYDPWNISYTFNPISASPQLNQPNPKSLNSSFTLIQDYNEQYSHRSFQKQTNLSNSNTFLTSNSFTKNKQIQYSKTPQEYAINSYVKSSTTPIDELMIMNATSRSSHAYPQAKQNFSFSETSSNYKNFAPTQSNTPTKLYNSNKIDLIQEEQENSDNNNNNNLPKIYKQTVSYKSQTPYYINTVGSIKSTQQSISTQNGMMKDETQEQLGEMLNQLKHHINLKKQHLLIKNKCKSPRRLKRLSADFNQIVSQKQESKKQQIVTTSINDKSTPINNKVTSFNNRPSSINNKTINQKNVSKLNHKSIPDNIKNILFKKIAEQKRQKQNDE